jgi:hypothetical protein
MSLTTHVPEQVLERAATLAWAARLRTITPEALAVHSARDIAEAQEFLNEAVRLELMEEKAILVGYSSLYTVTRSGRSLARKYADAGGYAYPAGLKMCYVAIGRARHSIACASAAAVLERRYPEHRVIGDVELRLEERAQKCPLITMDLLDPRWARAHSPDLVMWPPGIPGKPRQLPIAVEVELNLKSRDELLAICRALARCGSIEAALYFAENTKIERKLGEVIEELKAEDRIVVNPLSELVGSLPGFNFPSAEPAK